MSITTALLAAALAGMGPGPEDGAALIRQMRARYDGAWYRTVTFVQTTRFTGRPEQTWYEAMELPGKLRIDVAPLADGNAILFRNDSLYRFRGGSPAGSVRQVHPLLLLGFDVYSLPADETITKLKAMDFDLSVIHEGTWQDRPVWVVGAAEGDLETPQFWIDQERLYCVRLLRPADQNPSINTEVQFNNYQPLGDGWIAPQMAFFSNGTKVLVEEYDQIRGDVDLPDGLFLPDSLAPAGWIEG